MVRTTDGRRPALTTTEIRKRAKNIKLLLTDADGVLTDGGIYYSASGEELYRFSRRDGMGVDVLRKYEIETGIVTSENSDIVMRRAEKLRLRYVYLGIKDKLGFLPEILKASGLTINQLAYIGDDINDLAIMVQIGQFGLTGSPSDAVSSVTRVASYNCSKAGGHGAFREFAEWIVHHRG